MKKKEIKYLTADEVKQFLTTVKKGGSVRDLLYFNLLFHYGLRASEGLGIELEAIKPSPEYAVEIFIHRLKNGISRHYPVRQDDAKLLKLWLRKRKKLPNAKHNKYLFITAHSHMGRMSLQMVSKLTGRYSTEAGLEKVKESSHVFRHSCAVNLLLKDFDIHFVKNWLGHKDIASTMIYTEYAPPQWKEMSERAINSAFDD